VYVLVAEDRPSDHEAGLQIIRTTEIPVGDDLAAALRNVLGSSDCRRLVWLLPGADVVWREESIAVSDEDEASYVIDLQAEARLPESIPAYRRGGALCRTGVGQAIVRIAGWPERDDDDAGDPGSLGDVVRYAPETAALSALVGNHGASEIWYFARPDDGALTISIGGVRHRAARLGEAESDRIATARNLVVESLLAAGWDAVRGREQADLVATALRDGTPVCRVPDALVARWTDESGAPRTSRWWSQYGLALGAAIGAMGGADQSGLFELRAVPVSQQRSVLERGLVFLASPRRAMVALVASVLLWVIIPLAASGARLAALEWRMGDSSDFARRQIELNQQVALNQEVASRRWPMSKLLADVAGAMPPDIELDDLTLPQGQPVLISGLAGSLADVIEFQENLQNTRIFENVELPHKGVSETGRVEFRLQAEVMRPYRVAEPTYDYIARNLQSRLYGSTTEPDEDVDASATEIAVEEGDGSANDSTTLEQPRAVRDASPLEAPSPLTQDDIAKMTYEECRTARIDRLKVIRHVDDETAERLKQENEWLKEAMQQKSN
jgi:Tfp pilus assembly protein PilN